MLAYILSVQLCLTAANHKEECKWFTLPNIYDTVAECTADARDLTTKVKEQNAGKINKSVCAVWMGNVADDQDKGFKS